ncbi:MAG: hypothetical protein ACRDRN_15205 [Sciscionella sp.]
MTWGGNDMVTIIAVGAVLFCGITLLGRFLDRHAIRHLRRELAQRKRAH